MLRNVYKFFLTLIFLGFILICVSSLYYDSRSRLHRDEMLEVNKIHEITASFVSDLASDKGSYNSLDLDRQDIILTKIEDDIGGFILNHRSYLNQFVQHSRVNKYISDLELNLSVFMNSVSLYNKSAMMEKTGDEVRTYYLNMVANGTRLISVISSMQQAMVVDYSQSFEWFSLLIVCIALGVAASLSFLCFEFVKQRKNLKDTLIRLGSKLHDSDKSVSKMHLVTNQGDENVADAISGEPQVIEKIYRLEGFLEDLLGYVKKLGEVNQLLSSKSRVGQQIIGNFSVAIDSINEANRDAQEISNVIDEISVRSKVINQIVFKTRLLSFNASIEANRAGHYGRGFAVVAEEIGNLARVSGGAAKDIESLLEDSMAHIARKRANSKVNIFRGTEFSDSLDQYMSEVFEGLDVTRMHITDMKNFLGRGHDYIQDLLDDFNSIKGELNLSKEQLATVHGLSIDLMSRNKQMSNIGDSLNRDIGISQSAS